MANPLDTGLVVLSILRTGRTRYENALSTYKEGLGGAPRWADEAFSSLVTHLISCGLVAYSTGGPPGTIPPPPIAELWLTDEGRRLAKRSVP